MPVRDVSALFDTKLRYPDVPSDKYPKGKTYLIPSPSAEDGAALTAQAALGTKLASGKPLTDDERGMLKLDDEEERTFYQRVLGPVYDEMVEDGVDWVLLTGIANDAFLMITDNAEMADALIAVRGGRQGEAPAPGNRATRRAAARKSGAAKRKAGSKSSRASGATPASTPDPASTPTSTTPETPAVESA